MRRAVLYICYYHVTEPLVQTQVLAYLRELARRGVAVHLLTFEEAPLPRRQQSDLRAELEQAGIRWYSLPYHRQPSLPATLFDIAVGTVTALGICLRHNIRFVHARSHVAAAMALPLKRLLGCRFLFDVRGLLAEEYADAGHWKPASLKYRLTKRMEAVFFRAADALVMLTDTIKRELLGQEPALHARGPDIEVIPCCVDTDRFRAARDGRDAYRRERGWAGRRVLTYVGKLGTWYLASEMARFFAVLHKIDARFVFQVLTQSEPAPMRQALHEAGVPPEAYDIRFAPPEQVPLVLSASDAGISFIRPCYSKKSSSPTKVGEYLAAGLPVVSTSGIGDCDRMFGEHRLGVVVREFSETEYRRAAGELSQLLEDSQAAERCRRFADQELSLVEVGGARYYSVYERLFRDSRRHRGQQAGTRDTAPSGFVQGNHGQA